MATQRSVDFLPEIFQTDTNKQFLSATLDQLVQEPKFEKTEGLIGRRTGPGVAAADSYVIEPNKTRADYQLETAVVSLDPADTSVIKNIITYPGIQDALAMQGADSQRPDRLYASEFYAFDPFIDLDSFINFSQYYWLANGPLTVDVTATDISVTSELEVTRSESEYTFSGYETSLPTIDLIRGGNYRFQIQQATPQTVALRVTRTNVTSYNINQVPNEPLTLIRGNTYQFVLNVQGNFPFWIKTKPTVGLADQYNSGVLRNGAITGQVSFTVPRNAPDQLYYQCENQQLMGGSIRIQDPEPGTGPRFWIQTSPGVTGQDPTTPNISSRQVLGVTNNGIDVGTVLFNVPQRGAQDFYATLNDIGSVDLVTDLKFNQIDGAALTDLIDQFGGIDGVRSLNNRTLIFNNNILDAVDGGWFYADGSPVNPTQYRNVWRISVGLVNDIQTIQLISSNSIPINSRFVILFGTEYSSTNWWKNSQTLLDSIPVLSAPLDVLWYQDSVNPNMFGQIRLFDEGDASTLYIESILGQTNYVSPNGVAFTNGLKVRFPTITADGTECLVVPKTYASFEQQQQCVSTQAGVNLISCETTQDIFVGQTVVFSGFVFGGIQASVTYYVNRVFSSSQFSVSLVRGGPSVPLTTTFGIMTANLEQSKEYYVSGVGSSIQLLDVDDFYTPETALPDFGNLNTPDYLTIDRASLSRNAWSRSNRWFHIDVINASAAYNQTEINLSNAARAKRPILQYRPNIRLFNMGTQGKLPVDVIDVDQTDALSNVEGATAYTIYNDPVSADQLRLSYQYEIMSLGNTDWNTVANTNGVIYSVGQVITVSQPGTGNGTARTFVPLTNGLRVIFAADIDQQVRNKIYVVNFITPDTQPPLIAQPIINLQLATDGLVQTNESTVVLQGQQQAQTFWYDGVDWIRAQQKSQVQQSPLFDVYNSAGESLSNSITYPSTTFRGSALFSYAPGEGVEDAVLRFSLQYETLENIGDIVFDNNFFTDTFSYVREKQGVTESINTGFVREYSDRTEFQRRLGWQTAPFSTRSPQQFEFQYSGSPLLLDVAALPDTVTVIPSVKVFVDNQFQDPSTYSIKVTDNTTEIKFNTEPLLGSLCEVSVFSDQVSAVAFYLPPMNLELNPFNLNSDRFTLGTVRTHYQSICQNLVNITGEINGANNSRDLGNIIPYGQIIVQQSAPMTLAGYFLRSSEYDIYASLNFNSQQYQKFKDQMLQAVTEQTVIFETAAQVLDRAMADITPGRTDQDSFYWSDMVPSGSNFVETTYTVSIITGSVFDTVQTYSYTSSNYLGMNVYLNDQILLRGSQYVVSSDGPRITVLVELSLGDVLTIREFTTTAGSFVPNTPSKMGLYPLWKPEIQTVKTSAGTQTVIVGHDGSQTVTFGDVRDDVLLEFEKRIYNNFKLDNNPVPLSIFEVLPGQFRRTGFSSTEITALLATEFLTYVGWNKLDYSQQNYDAANNFTWNYSQTLNRLDNTNLLGAWRGIYRSFYDTQQPELTPWEMLGFSQKPDWWSVAYSDGPYTSNNMNLWDDLAAGIVRDPMGTYVNPLFVRPGLTRVIPTDADGALLPPLNSVVGTQAYQYRKSWQVGDGGPVEASWWNSSEYPFAVMKVLISTQSAKFFALFADRDLYRYDRDFSQYLYDQRFRLDAAQLQLYGNGVSKASYVNWIIDYNRLTGINSTQALSDDLSNLDVRLAYRMASFSDKQYIKLYVEKSSPITQNTSLLLPDESYQLLLYRNQPFAKASYSAVVVQRTDRGWSVFGYNTVRPYFEILTAVPVGQFETFAVAGIQVRVPANYTNQIQSVPYGTVFDTPAAVITFLLGYGQRLEQQGWQFVNQDNGYTLTWPQMAQEFLYWSQQGWGSGSLINLNPLATGCRISRPQSVVDSLAVRTLENVILNQNKQEFAVRDLNIVRLGNEFRLQPLINDALASVNLNWISWESVIVLDNTSLFGDVIYDPITGIRQSRIKLIAATTTDWNGTIDAQGFVLNQGRVPEWNPNLSYTKGSLVKYKNSFYSAANIVQPSSTFNYADWLRSDFTETELGLLPNIALKANQLSNSYNINEANLESDNDLLSYGLIGYRPREYLSALILDDVSQVNVYRQLLASKGTINSVDLIGRARLTKEAADYSVYENWAVLLSTYGANAVRRFIDLRLNQAVLTSNPSTVQLILPGAASTADQPILIRDVWNSSFTVTTPDVFPVLVAEVTDTALPSAGYVNFDDVDITVFSFDNPNNLFNNLDSIQVGTTVWVAKTNSYDWNVYRLQNISGHISHVCENLDGTCLVKFTQPHGLSLGDFFVIRFLDTEVNGVHRVQQLVSATSLNILLDLIGQRTVINGNGIAFRLVSIRVPQASDIVNQPLATELLPGAKFWVDNNGNNQWQVLEKRSPFSSAITLSPRLLDASENYGAAVAQSTNRAGLFVGSPRYGFASGVETGAVYVYVSGLTSEYTPVSAIGDSDDIVTLATTGVRALGSSLSAGLDNFAVAGASASLGPASQANNGYALVLWNDSSPRPPGVSPWKQLQLLVQPGTTPSVTAGAGEFGYSVVMSLDQRWMYVGQPGLNLVSAYGRVEWQIQQLAFISTGLESQVNIANQIQISNANQLLVTESGRVLVLGVDYTVSAALDQVIFLVTLTAGSLISIQRRTQIALAGGTASYAVTTYLFGITVIDAVTVFVDDVIQRPNIDYTFTGSAVVFEPGSVPGALSVVTLISRWYYRYVTSFTASGLTASDRFGHSVVCSTDGRQIIVGTPYSTEDGLSQAGSVFVFDRNVQKFIYGTDTSSVSFTVLGSVTEPVAVLVNGVYLVNQAQGLVNAANTFTVSGSTVTINADLVIGDVIEIETNQFVECQQILQNEPEQFSNFGQALDICSRNCSVYVGAPQSSQINFKGGVVERWVNQARVYGSIASTATAPVLTVGHTLRVNDVDCVVPAATATVTSLQGLANNITATAPNAVATVTDGVLRIAVVNANTAAPGDLLQVEPGSVGTAFADLGFETFVYTQTISSPVAVDQSGFGSQIQVDSSAVTLAVSAPKSTAITVIEFDIDPVTQQAKVNFDGNATDFFSEVVASGVVYTYDLLNSSSNSVSDPDKFVFGQQIIQPLMQNQDSFGTGLSYRSGVLLTSAPFHDFSDSTAGFGAAYLFRNTAQQPAWQVVRQQSPEVDISLISSIYTYDRITSAKTEFFDFFNPLQGKILGAAAANIDLTGAVDPAQYNVGAYNNAGNYWAQAQLGKVWWNTTNVRFVDANQNDLDYAAARWGTVFPGSQIEIYQWITSTVEPALYAGPGTPFDINRYTVVVNLDVTGVFVTNYFYWVRNITTPDINRGKTLSVSTVADYISNPKASGIPYAAPLSASALALYNAYDTLSAFDSVVSVEFNQQSTDANVHQEFELVVQGRADSFVSDITYRKLQDSFCGVDQAGNLVPDVNLPPALKYGVSFRPRQSMFVNRFLALQNYIQSVNKILSRYPITEIRSFDLLQSQEPVPPSSVAQGGLIVTVWNLEVADLEILSFQNINQVPLGYRYLVLTDNLNQNLWTIYEVQLSDSGSRTLTLVRVQNFKTSNYWSYIDWYDPGYNPSNKILYTVANYADLATLDAPVGTSAKVLANTQGLFEIYLYNGVTWSRVALQNGTIEISAELYNYNLGRFGFDVEVFDAQYFDQEPVIETRKIIQAINQQLLIGDLLLERNNLLVLMFNYILSEQLSPAWLNKTSLIDVDHRIRELVPYENYVRDNQDFVLQYLQEAKPYHVQVKEFNLKYFGLDSYQGGITDFDVPAYYNNQIQPAQFVSPILLPYTLSLYQPFNILSDAAADNVIWQQWPWSQWFANHTMKVASIVITDGGTGYTEPPLVIVETADGDQGSGAQAVATVVNGSVVAITVTTGGSNYSQTPRILFDGGNGTLAKAYAVMTNSATRKFTTRMRFDRYQFNSTVVDWSQDGTYVAGSLVRYNNAVWQALSADGSSAVVGPNFDLENWQLVPAQDLGAVNRIQGYYQPLPDESGLDLTQLLSGIRYPGVQVFGNYYLRSAPVPTVVSCTSTSAANNAIGCASTVKMMLNAPVAFYGSVFGNIVATVVYYIKDIIDISHFTVSDTVGGNVVVLSTATGNMTVLLDQPLDAQYASAFTDQYLGIRPSDINVEGGAYVDVYEGHAPEELVNGSEFDTVDIRVYTRPGSDWTDDGHGFQFQSTNYVFRPTDVNSYSWADVVEHPVEIVVSNQTTGLQQSPNINYTIDYDAQTISILNGFVDNDIINITCYELGGGSQLYRLNTTADQVDTTVIVPVDSDEIYEIALFVNGTPQNTATWEPYAHSESWSVSQTYEKQSVVLYLSQYYRALQSVPPGILLNDTAYWLPFVPDVQSLVSFNTVLPPGSGIALVVMGIQTPQRSWSTALTETVTADESVVLTRLLPVVNSLQGTNPANIIVVRNGRRLRPAAGIRWEGDDTSTDFGLPQRLGFNQDIINAATDITVWVDNVLQTQNSGIITGTYFVTNWDGSNSPGRQVRFFTPPAAGSVILISVSTQSDYVVAASTGLVQVVGTVNLGDVFELVTWNDTSEQDILTTVYVGPVTTSSVITEPYDSTSFDPATVNFDPGSFDYTVGTIIFVNEFDLPPGAVANRLWVTLNGDKLIESYDYTVQNNQLILSAGAVATNDVVAITSFTADTVPEAMAFRIFQDMQGTQTTYRITENTTTVLSANMDDTQNFVYVEDVAKLQQPDLAAGVFGTVTVNGERMTYRDRDLANNRLLGVRRGTGGTGASSHLAGSPVYDMGPGNAMSMDDQNYVVSNTSVGDGSTVLFYAPDISVTTFGDSSSIFTESIEVSVGGQRSRPGFDPSAALIGQSYMIVSVGTTDWHAMGLDPDIIAMVGVVFEVSATGTGTGLLSDSMSSYYYRVTDYDPLAVEFITRENLEPPISGVQVTILERRGVNWYQPANGEPSDGRPLQITDTTQARFLRGL